MRCRVLCESRRVTRRRLPGYKLCYVTTSFYERIKTVWLTCSSTSNQIVILTSEIKLVTLSLDLLLLLLLLLLLVIFTQEAPLTWSGFQGSPGAPGENPRSQVEIDRNSIHIHTAFVVRGGRRDWSPLRQPDFPRSTAQGILSRWSPIQISTPPKGLNFGEQSGTSVFPLVIAVPLFIELLQINRFILDKQQWRVHNPIFAQTKNYPSTKNQKDKQRNESERNKIHCPMRIQPSSTNTNTRNKV